VTVTVNILSEKGGELKIRLPFKITVLDSKIKKDGEMLIIS
jgi:hypothetical protein